jgi:nitric oxide reductase subunit B
MLITLISLLPVGVLQTIANIKHGKWYARSYEFMQDPALQTLRRMRIFGDSLFAIGSVALSLFVVGLKRGWSIDKTMKEYK